MPKDMEVQSYHISGRRTRMFRTTLMANPLLVTKYLLYLWHAKYTHPLPKEENFKIPYNYGTVSNFEPWIFIRQYSVTITLCNWQHILLDTIFPDGASGKESACQFLGLIPGSGRNPGVGNGNSFQFFCLENSTDRRARWAVLSMGLQRVGHGRAVHTCVLARAHTHTHTLLDIM